MITKELLISRGLELQIQLGRVPTFNEYLHHYHCGKGTLQRLMGSWSNFSKITFNITKPKNKKRPIIACVKCSTPTKNPRFCSVKCAVTTNNTKRKRRRNHCPKCQNPIDQRSKHCRMHSMPNPITMAVTIGHWRRKSKHNAHAQVREHARNLYFQSGQPQSCFQCGYSLHVDVCHIKPIGSFQSNTPILIINRLTNLVGLCVRCHWEFDHGHLKLKLDAPDLHWEPKDYESSALLLS